MTKHLEQAIAAVRELSETEQDAAADALFAHLAGDHKHFALTAEQVAEVRRIQRDLRSGREQFASDDSMEAVWRKCDL